jgi:hypothetical protein
MNIKTINKGIRGRGNIGKIEREEMNSSNHKTSPDGAIS